MSETKLISIQIGTPERLGCADSDDPLDQPWESAIFKKPVEHAIQLTETGLVGDKVANRKNHGGFDKAVLAYSFEHYERWNAELDKGMGPGGFGENFTVTGMDESNVCIGDTWSIGDVARVQVSQPRQPCWKLQRMWHLKQLPALVRENNRTGWYLRILDEGCVEAGMELKLLERPNPEWTIIRANEAMNTRRKNPELAEELAKVELLAGDWREGLYEG